MKCCIGKSVSVCMALMITFSATAQDEVAQEQIMEVETEYRPGSNRHSRALARQQIADLKNGAILVRLQTKEHTLRALREAGLNGRADREEKELLAKNRDIVEAFRVNFSFCPSYFFFSDQSEKILNGELKNVEFLNADLEPDPSIDLDHGTYLIAEFGNVTEDTAGHFSGYRTEVNGNWSVERVPTYYGSTNMGFGALIVKSDRMVQLKRPFPYYVRTFDMLRSVEKCVSKLNRKLLRYYGRNS